MRKRIAIFKRPDDLAGKYCLFMEEELERHSELVRVTEYLDIDFPVRVAAPDMMQKEAAHVDEEIKRHQAKIDALKAKKTAILSLVFSPEAA
jgi:hypothetical protein